MCMKCSFCGNLETDNLKVVEGKDFNICEKCFKILEDDFKENFYNENNSDVLKTLMKPHEIKQKLDEYIIGQEDAKKILSVAVYNHYKRIYAKTNVDIRKTNVMMIGPTGSGKTYIIETLAKFLNVPFVTVDATSFTEAGYVGDDVEEILKKLYIKSGKDISSAEKGIVYIDEVDKLLSKTDDSSKKDVNGMGVQQSLLKILENSEVTFKLKTNDLEQKEVTMNTKNILFIAGGAFVGLDKVVEKRLKDNNVGTMGFNVNQTNIEIEKNNDEDITSEDIIKYGMIPEFVGRVPVFVKVNKLSDEDLENILTKPKDSITKQYISLFKMDGIRLKFDKECLQYVVKEAQKKKLGARGLKGVLDKQMNSLMYEIPQHKISEITITKDILVSNESQIKEILINKEKENS